MGKTIRLDDQTYERLEELRVKRETYSQVVERLLTIAGMLEHMSPLLYPGETERPRGVRDDNRRL